MNKAKVYIANPLIFSPATKGWYEEVMIPAVEKYMEVVNKPGEFPGLDEKMTDQEKSKAIFDHNVDKLEECELVICVLDGVQTDDGTAWEVGYAWAQGKPTIAVRFDFRRGCREAFSEYTNLMIENCCLAMENSLEDLERALDRYINGQLG